MYQNLGHSLNINKFLQAVCLAIAGQSRDFLSGAGAGIFLPGTGKKIWRRSRGKMARPYNPGKNNFFFYVSSSVVRRGQCLQPLLYRYNTLCYCLIPVPVSAKNQTFFSFSLSNFGGVMLSIICPPDGLFQQKPTENQIWVLAALAFLKKIRQIFVDCHCVRVVLFNTDTLVLI